MRRLILTFLLSAPLLILPGAKAADVGTIRGIAIDGESGQPRSDVRIVLTGANEDGTGRLKRDAITGEDGRYVFRNLPTGNDRYYIVDGYFEDGLFPGRAVTLPDDTSQSPIIETTLKVWPTTTDPGSIVIRRADLFALSDGDSDLGIIESVTVANITDHAYVGRGRALDTSDSDTPTLGFALPPRATDVSIADSDIDVPELVPIEGIGFGVTFAIPPGETKIVYAYSVPGTAGNFDLSRRALYPILEMSVLTEPPIVADTNRLERDGEVDVEGTTYSKWTTEETIDAADPIQISLTAEAGFGPGLIAGIVAAGLLVVVLGALAARRARRVPAVRATVEDVQETRGEIVAAIARLDLEHDGGRIDDDEWLAARTALKDRLRSEKVPEPT